MFMSLYLPHLLQFYNAYFLYKTNPRVLVEDKKVLKIKRCLFKFLTTVWTYFRVNWNVKSTVRTIPISIHILYHTYSFITAISLKNQPHGFCGRIKRDSEMGYSVMFKIRKILINCKHMFLASLRRILLIR